MARSSRPRRRLSTVDRLDRLRASVPVRDDSPSIESLIEQRHQREDDRQRVTLWFTIALALDPRALTSDVCCETHALRRTFEWVRGDDGATDLDAIERRHACVTQTAS